MERPDRKSTMRKLVCQNSGFTFVETLVAFSIVGIFLALTWATVNFLLLKAGDQVERTRAHFLAVEGVELMRQIRQTAVNRDRETGFKTAIGSRNGSYILTPKGSEFELGYGQNEQIEMNEEPYTTYCRTVDFSGSDDNAKTATVTVRWGDPENCALGDKMIAYSTYLADLTH